MFQFHNGSIKGQNIASSSTIESGFNSTMVRLKVDSIMALTELAQQVSIPQWFD